jgi:prepilin-type N-terminal cleavage/methylation domain-containing protein
VRRLPARAHGLPARAHGLPARARGLPARARGFLPRARGLPAAARGDDGFTIVEVLCALAVIAVVLTSTTAVYIRSMVLVDEQGSRQTALQVATDGMEAFRGVSTSGAVAWLQAAANARQTKTLNSVTYTLAWRCDSGVSDDPVPPLPGFTDCPSFVPAASDDVLYAQLIVGWQGRTCPAGGCTYGGAVTELSLATFEPVFDTTQ